MIIRFVFYGRTQHITDNAVMLHYKYRNCMKFPQVFLGFLFRFFFRISFQPKISQQKLFAIKLSVTNDNLYLDFAIKKGNYH